MCWLELERMDGAGHWTLRAHKTEYQSQDGHNDFRQKCGCEYGFMDKK